LLTRLELIQMSNNLDRVHTLKDTWRRPWVQLLTKEEIAAEVIKDSAVEEESDNELDELQESTIKKKIRSSTRDGTMQ
jgi:hypothetical protein